MVAAFAYARAGYQQAGILDPNYYPVVYHRRYKLHNGLYTLSCTGQSVNKLGTGVVKIHSRFPAS